MRLTFGIFDLDTALFELRRNGEHQVFDFIARLQERPQPVECDPEIANPDGELVRQGAIAGSKDAGGACLFPAQPGLVPDRPHWVSLTSAGSRLPTKLQA